MKLTHNIENSICYKIFVTVFLLIAVHASPDGPQNGRYLNAVSSLVQFGNFALQEGYYQPHVDTVSIGGNLYSVIPPGIPLILAPQYSIYRNIALSLGFHPSEPYWGLFTILTNVFVMAPMLGLVSVMMFKLLGKFTENLSKKLWLVFIFVFGSPIFFYSTYGIWSHAYTICFLFTAFYLTVNRRNNFLIGLCLGLAQLVDYAAIVPISLIGGFWVFTKIKNKSGNLIKDILSLFMGYMACFLPLLYYNYSITGSVFETPTDILHSQFLTEPTFSIPSFKRIFGLTISPYRGIFWYFPMTFLFVCSLFKKSSLKSEDILFSGLYFAFIFAFNSTYFAWSGDVCFGPRHLVSAIPFIIIPIVYCPLKYIKMFGILSIFVNLAGVSTIPSDNLLKNIGLFLSRGPFPQWLIYLHKTILPKYFNIELSVVTPFFIYTVMALVIYSIWIPRKKRWMWLTQDTCTTKVLSQRHLE